jgi:hypothetical protein
MLNRAAGTEYDRDLARLRELQQAVLLHLLEVGPTTWDALYIRFNLYKTDEVTHTVRDLVQWKYITVEADSTTRITASGANKIQRRSP